jgi:hypothetical protein
MDFNYDNPYMCAMAAPHNAACQFLMNCLSLTQTLVPVGSNDFIDETIRAQGKNYESKFKNIFDQLPKESDSAWHQRMIHNTAWLATAPYAKESLEIEDYGVGYIHVGFDDQLAARKYLNHYWRDPAKKVSNNNLGFVLPGHQTSELDAWILIFPNIKYFTVANYDNWIKANTRKKNFFQEDIQRWWREGKAIYEPKGFIFDLESLLFKLNSFEYQMAKAFDYFGFNDYDSVKDHLTEYKNSYIKANINWNRSRS